MEKCRKEFSDDKINQRIRLESGHLDRAYMIGYNNACEKVLQYLEKIQYIRTVKIMPL